MKSNDTSSRRGGLTESDVGDGAGAGEDADSPPPPASIIRKAIDDIGVGGDLEDMRSKDVGAIASDDNGRLGLVLGTRRTAARAAERRRDQRGVLIVSGWIIVIILIELGIRVIRVVELMMMMMKRNRRGWSVEVQFRIQKLRMMNVA